MSNSEAYLYDHSGSRKFVKKVNNPFKSKYDTLMDSSADLGPIF